MASLSKPDDTDTPLAHIRAVTKAAGSSFYWAMRILPPERRDAMFAIYAFCREVDDIADGDMADAEKLRRLDMWRREIDAVYAGAPTYLTARALVEPAQTYALEQEEFIAVIDGMEMDARGEVRAPDMATLKHYCRRVAGAVGLLSIRAFGAPDAREFAISLGNALQFTNILRDLREDAAMGRLYLPRELLEAHGVRSNEPDTVLSDPALPKICRELGHMAERFYADAERALEGQPRTALKPAVVMMMNYRRILRRLIESGWRDIDREIGVSTPEKLWIALRYGLLKPL